MKFLSLALFLVCSISVASQKVINVRYPAASSEITLLPGLDIPTKEGGYTLWLPKYQKSKGMIVFTYENRDSLQQDRLIRTAMNEGLAVIFLTTDHPLEFLFDEKRTKSLAEDIVRVCDNFGIPHANLLYAGHSIAGTRALKLAIFTKQNKAFKHISPKAIAIADVPLDMNRYYSSCQEEMVEEVDALSANSEFSGMDFLSSHLDGTPTTSKARYTSYSPYSKTVRNGGNAPYFNDVYVRAYVDFKVNWTNERQGGNAYDLANFVNQLKLLGNDNATLIQAEAPRKAKSTWDIVDERKLVQWFSKMCNPSR